MRLLFLSSLGILVGLLSLPGWLSDIEVLIWVFLSVFAAIIIAADKHKSLVLYCLSLGFLWAIGAAAVQVLFYSYFIKNNAGQLQSLSDLPQFLSPRLLPLFSAPILAIVLSFITWVSVQIVRKLK